MIDQADSIKQSEIIIELSRLGNEPLISRSQAKRIILGLEKFQHVTLDFSGVRLAGQGFVDEVFRVFANAHSNITIEYIQAIAFVADASPHKSNSISYWTYGGVFKLLGSEHLSKDRALARSF